MLTSELPQSYICVVILCTGTECDELKPPEYGDVKLSGLTIGSHATYACDDGFELLGNEFRTCEADGEWSGTDPNCQGIIETFMCAIIVCGVAILKVFMNMNFL